MDDYVEFMKCPFVFVFNTKKITMKNIKNSKTKH